MSIKDKYYGDEHWAKEGIKFERTKELLPDIEDCIKEGIVKAIPLNQYIKKTFDNDWNKKDYSFEDLNSLGNIGLIPGYNLDKNGMALCVIDIDGINDKDPESQRIIYDALKDIPNTIHVRSASGGRHIYLMSKNVVENVHEVSNKFAFPDDLDNKELGGKCLDGAIEIFCKEGSRQCATAGSFIREEAEKQVEGQAVQYEYSEYEVVSEHNTFKDLLVVDDVNALVEEKLLEAGFKVCNRNSKVKTDVSKFDGEYVYELRELSNGEIDEVVDAITDFLPHMTQKVNKCWLCLSGFFKKYITENSARKIVERTLSVLDDSHRDHINTVTRSYERETNQYGLTELEKEILLKLPNYNIDLLRFILYKNILGKYNFQGNRSSKGQIEIIEIDYVNKRIDKYFKSFKNDKAFRTSKTQIFSASVLEYNTFFNVLDEQHKQESRDQVVIDSDKLLTKKIIEAASLDEIKNELKGFSLNGESLSILNKISAHLATIGYSKIEERFPVAGIFRNPKDGHIVRTDKDGLIIDVKKPSKKAVKGALEIWDALEKQYGHDNSKMAFVLRAGIRLPFSYIFKTEKGFTKMVFLYGASQSAKTSLSKIALMPWVDDISDHKVGGNGMNSDYKLGQKLESNGFGIIINEPGAILDPRDNYIEMIKNAVEDEYSREKMHYGKHRKIRAYANMIFTSNIQMPDDDALIRRTSYIEFDDSDQSTEEDIRRFNEFSNHYKTFKGLLPLGDFWVYYVDKHQDLLDLKEEEFVDALLEATFEYAGLDLPWMLQHTEQVLTFETVADSDRELLADVLRYEFKTNANSMRSEIDIDDYVDTWREICGKHDTDVCGFRKDGVVIFNRIKNKIRSKSLTANRIGSLLGKESEIYRTNNGRSRGFLLTIEEFLELLEMN